MRRNFVRREGDVLTIAYDSCLRRHFVAVLHNKLAPHSKTRLGPSLTVLVRHSPAVSASVDPLSQSRRRGDYLLQRESLSRSDAGTSTTFTMSRTSRKGQRERKVGYGMRLQMGIKERSQVKLHNTR